jgi:release factor glutamine methyltransferase
MNRRLTILLAICAMGRFPSDQAVAASSIVVSRPVPAPFQLGAWRRIEDLRWSVAQFKDVFWDPRDTPSLRGQIRTNNLARGKKVLEIGVGTGLLSLCSLNFGAVSVVGTDINPAALACAKYNAERFGWRQKCGLRLVSKTNSAAFAVIGKNEKFDLIISNPPWVDQKPKNDFEFALYDPGFELLRTLLEGLPQHLNPGGRVLLAYGSVSSIKTLYALSKKHGYQVKVIDDDRKLDNLPEEFLPGMTLEVIVPPEELKSSAKH